MGSNMSSQGNFVARVLDRIKVWNGGQKKNASGTERKSSGRKPAPEPLRNTRNLNKERQNELNRQLLDAAKNGEDDKVERLLKRKADVNATDNATRSALMKAARKGHTNIVRLLIGKGANVNAKDYDNVTVLMGAVVGGNKEIIELLIRKKADVNAKNKNNRTVLDYAERAHKTEVTELLRMQGAKLGSELP